MSIGRRLLIGSAVSMILVPFVYAESRLRHLETLDAVDDAPWGGHASVDGMLIHYECAGEGIPIVLIHGFGGSTYSWRFNLEPLAKAGYRVCALDLPGFGYSERTTKPVFTPTVQARVVRSVLGRIVAASGVGGVDVIGGISRAGEAPEESPGAGSTGDLESSTHFDGQGKEPAVLVGASLGAAAALRFAIDYPELTKALVLVAPATGFRPFWRRFGGVFSLPVFGRVLARTLYFYAVASEKSAAKMMASAYGSRYDRITEEMRDSLLRPLRVRGSADSALGLARSEDLRPLVERLQEISAPILMVAGADDHAVPVGRVERLQEKLPTARLVVMRQAGHLVQEDVPKEFNRLVLDFLGSVENMDAAPKSGRHMDVAGSRQEHAG